MEKEDVKENVNGKFEHFLKAVEFLGNKLPDITILFLIAFFSAFTYSGIFSLTSPVRAQRCKRFHKKLRFQRLHKRFRKPRVRYLPYPQAQ